MAYETGTATDHADLYDKLLAFLTTNASLVSANQEWATVWQASTSDPNPTDIVLRGPGLSGTDQVYVGLRLTEDVGNDRFSIQISGMTGVLAGATTFTGHVNNSAILKAFPDDTSMTYWFIASGRRFIAAWKVSTVYQALYGGFYLPYASPLSYPYPMFIGGAANNNNTGQFVVNDWRSVSDSHSLFPYPSRRSVGSDSGYYQAYVLNPLATWKPIYGVVDIGAVGSNADLNSDDAHNMGPGNFTNTYNPWRNGTTGTSVYPPINGDATTNTWGYQQLLALIREGYGGYYPLTPFTITSGRTENQTYGILDGVYHVQGFNNSAENIITVDGVDHLVLPNVFRTTASSFFAIRLE